MDECLLSPTSDPFNPFFAPFASSPLLSSTTYHTFDITPSTSGWYPNPDPDPVYPPHSPKRPRSQRSMSSASSGGHDSRPILNNIRLDDSPSKVRPLSPAVLPNYKTEFCNKYQESGYCPFGDRCQFVHEFHELQRRGRALTYKTRMCWSGDECRYQQNHGRCVYLHGDETAEMFDQQRGISYARVQNILMNKELRQQQQQHKGMNKKHQRQRHWRHSDEDSGTDPSSMSMSTVTSSLSTHPVNRHSFLSFTSSPSCNTEPSVLNALPTESYLSFNDPFDDLLDSLEEPTTESEYLPLADQAPPSPMNSMLPDMTFPSMVWSVSHLALQESYSMLDVARDFSPFNPSLLPSVSSSTGVHNDQGSTGPRLIAQLVTDLQMPQSDNCPPSDLLSPGMMPDIDLPYMVQGRLYEWQDPCFEDDESFAPSPEAFDQHQDLSSADHVSTLASTSPLIRIQDQAIQQQYASSCKVVEDSSSTSPKTVRKPRKCVGNLLLGLLARRNLGGLSSSVVIGRPKELTLSLECGSLSPSSSSGMGVASLGGAPGSPRHYKLW
ncbi:hypothetical protein CPB97_008897 [Podila verticillata]|nr:hypothetical protein CPB97_008897 [Podila verticillata]